MQKRIGEIIYVKFPDGEITKYEVIDRNFIYRKNQFLYSLKCAEQNSCEVMQRFEIALDDNSATEQEYLSFAGQLLTKSIEAHKSFMKKIDDLTDCF